jgi:hypothetical protein
LIPQLKAYLAGLLQNPVRINLTRLDDRGGIGATFFFSFAHPGSP